MVGKTLGHYEILEPLGAGGMGEVYRARDTKLDRDVAIKVLPEDFAADAERLARFTREAKLLASLNHPNIAAVYGLEDEGQTRFIAMELVEGETLAKRLREQERLDPDEALELAADVARALAAAHDSGVIHRDLKPANVLVTAEGSAKVLDFGLAKALVAEPVPSDDSQDLTQSPTIVAATGTDVILGTAPYMSPEQAKGKVVDKRADLWSFGCVLYEMLTGRLAFDGADVSDTLAAILKDEPDWSAVPDDLPPSMTGLLRRCLSKDPRERMRDAGDAALEIAQARRGPEGGTRAEPVPHPGSRIGPVAWLMVAAAVVGTTLVMWTLRPPTGDSSPSRLSVTLAEGHELPLGLSNALAVSPDGQTLVYAAREPGVGPDRLFLRDLDDFQPRPLPGTEGARSPFFSPDGAWLGFFAGDQIWKMEVPDGRPLPIVRTDLLFPSGTWGRDDTIVFSHFSLGLARVSADGTGEVELITIVNADAGEIRHLSPQFLPDGRILLTVLTSEGRHAAVLSLETGTLEIVLENAMNARYVPSGHLVFTSPAGLAAARFDLSTSRAGAAVPLGYAVAQLPTIGDAHFAVSEGGTLAFAPTDGPIAYTMAWVDREGNPTQISPDLDFFDFPRVSPDGGTIAVTRGYDIWSYDLTSGRGRPMTDIEGIALESIWSPDGNELIFTKHGPESFFDLYRMPAEGDGADPTHVLERDGRQFATSWSSTGLLGLYERIDEGLNIVVYDDGHEPVVLASAHNEHTPMFHPTGPLFAYESDETGSDELWVREYPGAWKRMITSGGGTQPRWSPSGDELFYRHGDTVFRVAFDATTSPPAIGEPEALFSGRYFFGNSGGGISYDIHPDGERFLMLRLPDPGPPWVNVVVNFFAELNERAPVGR